MPSASVSLAAFSYVGANINFLVPGRCCGFRVYVVTGAVQPVWAILWDTTTGVTMRAYQFRGDVPTAANKWLQAWFRPWLRVDTAHTYRLGVLMGSAYRRSVGALASPVTHNNIQFTNGWQSTSLYPPGTTITNNTNANGVDVLFQPD